MRRIRRIFPTVLVITALAGPPALAATVTSSAAPLAAHGQPGIFYRAAGPSQPGVFYRT
jgi:peptidoglycan/LPS O-acetylase OafA/YrhL